jgi:hypothetical protein
MNTKKMMLTAKAAVYADERRRLRGMLARRRSTGAPPVPAD